MAAVKHNWWSVRGDPFGATVDLELDADDRPVARRAD